MFGSKNRYEIKTGTEISAGEQCSHIKTSRNNYIEYMSKNLYERILFDVYAHIAEKKEFDTIVYDRYTPKTAGLISILADAMACKTKKYIKFERKNGTLFISKVLSADGLDVTNFIELDFTDFHQSSLVNDAFSIDYDNVLSVESSIISNKSIIAKIENMDQIMVSNNDPRKKKIFLSMITEMFAALKSGGIGVIAAGSDVQKIKLDTKPNSDARSAIYERLSSITGYPSIFMDGKQQATLGGSGESQNEASKLARQYYFHSILSPIISAISAKSVTLLPPLKNIADFKAVSDLLEMSDAFSERGREKIADMVGFQQEDLK